MSHIANAETIILPLRPELTLDVANKIAETCQARQLANKGAPLSIAIFDNGSNLVLFHRMTGASLGSGRPGSGIKSYVSARGTVPS